MTESQMIRALQDALDVLTFDLSNEKIRGIVEQRIGMVLKALKTTT